jgi:hypothetical protein
VSGGTLDYRLRIRSADGLSDALVVSSVRGDALPYLIAAPHGDGSEFDPITGSYRSGSATYRVADAITSGTSRVITSQLEDANFRQQLAGRIAFGEYRLNGGAWVVETPGIITGLRLTSHAVWDIDVGDTTRATRNLSAFSPLRMTGDTTRLEPFTTYITRWPKRGTIAGGGVRGGFLSQPDIGGWEMKAETPFSSGATRVVRLSFVAGWQAPDFHRSTNLDDFRATVNDAVGAPTGSYLTHTFAADFHASFWRDIVIEVSSITAGVTTINYYAASWFSEGGYTLFSGGALAFLAPAGLFVYDPLSTMPAAGTACKVRIFDALPSERCPIYYTGHPLDLWTKLCDESSLTYDSAAVTACKAAIGNGLTITLRITSTQSWASWVESTLYGPCGFSVSTNASGQLVPFATRIMLATVPTVTLTNADVPSESTVLFDLSEPDAITKVVFNQQNLLTLPALSTPYDPFGPRLPVVVGSVPPDGIRVQTVTVERTTGDTAAPVQREQSYTIPGFLSSKANATSYEPAYVDHLAAEIFDRFGRGRLSGEVALLRGGAGDPLTLGDEAYISLKAMPNHNKRLGDDGTVSGRCVQSVRLTPSPTGRRMRFMDSGPNAQSTATLPTLTLALGTDAGSVLVTITNAATLNASSTAVRLYWAVTTGAAPATGDYTPVVYFAAGQVPTTAIALPLVTPGRTVYVAGRSTKGSERPSSLGTAASITAAGIAAPTSVVLTIDPADGSRATLTWAIGSGAANAFTDVFLRLSSDPASADVRRATLSAGSTTYTFDDLSTGTAYTASASHRDPVSGYSTAKVTATGTTFGFMPLLAAPVGAVVFAGAQNSSTLDGSYGLAVVASVLPGSIEFREAVETAVGAGTFGTAASVALVSALVGDWTVVSRTAPNDGLKRRLSARSVRGSNASAWTVGLDVLPWSVVLRPAYTGAPVPTLAPFARTDTETTITYTWTRNAATDAVWIYDTLLTVSQADPYDAGTALPNVVLRSGTDTYTALKPPQGYVRSLHFLPVDLNGKAGAVIHIDINTAPSALSGTVKAVVTNGTADLTLKITGAAVNWPVAVDLYEDNPDSTPIYTGSLSASATITSATAPALGARALPLREVRRWYLRLVDVGGVIVWGIGSADRNALANGNVSRNDYKAAPALIMSYDDDTDAITVTTPTGKVKTYSPLGGSGTVTYTVGDVLDDATTETLFLTDETRTPYVVAFVGGGTPTEFFRGPLHGVASKTPTGQPRMVLSAMRDTADVYVKLASPTSENVTLSVRDSESAGAPEYALCVSSTDSTPLYVAAGTEVGPASWFTNTGVRTQRLAAIALSRDQIKRLYFTITGQNSGVQGSSQLTLSMKEQPWLESIAATWNAATGNYDVVLVGGANCASALIEIADNAAFASPTNYSGTLADGGSLSHSFALSGTQLGKLWYARGTPNNAAALAGLNGVSQVDSDAIPASPTGSASFSAASITVAGAAYNGAGATSLDIDWTPMGAPAGATYRLTVYEQTTSNALLFATTGPLDGVTAVYSFACANVYASATASPGPVGTRTRTIKMKVEMIAGASIVATGQATATLLSST